MNALIAQAIGSPMSAQLCCMKLTGRRKLHKGVFLEMTSVDEDRLRLWERQSEKYWLCVPPIHEDFVDAFLLFHDAVIGDAVEAECMIVIKRRGMPRTQEEVDACTRLHAQTDVPLLQRLAERLFVSEVRDFSALVLSKLRELYGEAGGTCVNVQKQQGMLRIEFNKCCVLCKKPGCPLQCACRQSVYYCNKECQRADWPRHRDECPARK